jgi:hypothetical protein
MIFTQKEIEAFDARDREEGWSRPIAPELKRVLRLPSENWDQWAAHPDGIVLRQGGIFSLHHWDGSSGPSLVVPSADWGQWDAHPDGVVFQKGDRLFFRRWCGPGLDVPLEDWDGWGAHPDGIVIRKGDTFSLRLWDGSPGVSLDVSRTDWRWWHTHRDGVVLRQSDCLSLHRWDGTAACLADMPRNLDGCSVAYDGKVVVCYRHGDDYELYLLLPPGERAEARATTFADLIAAAQRTEDEGYDEIDWTPPKT